MKKQLFFAFSFWLLAVGIKAAPPLRGLMPMNSGHGASVTPLAETVSPVVEFSPCVSQAAMIGNSSYLQHSGSPRVLTILAAFQDIDFTVNNPVQAFDQYLNADTLMDLGNYNQMNVASVRRYFEICSRGQFTPQFDVVGPVTLPQKMAYYGGKNDTGSDDRFGDFCRDAMNQAKEVVADWSQYDNDGDGRIELVCVIFAGFGQNQGGADSTIWAKASHQNRRLNDTMYISRFNCCSELFHPQRPDYINGTGVFIHEFSHCMGLPDLYATSKKAQVNNQGMETYSIMDYGLYNHNGFAPCPYTAWEQEVMGWTEMEEVKSDEVKSEKYLADILPLIEGGKAYKLVNENNDRDYIVMENVQKRGLNEYASGHGLLVYHVDYPYTSVNMGDTPNNNPGHPSVAVVPAGGLFINSYLRGNNLPYTRKEWQESLSSATFPGTKAVTSLSDQMLLPNYCFWNDDEVKNVGFALSNISEDAETGTVSFAIVSGDAAGIDDVRWQTDKWRGPVYDLQGCKVVNPTRGLYIVNGKKVVVK